MKVLHLIYTLNVGGAETMLADIANGQVARGLDVSILVVNNGINEDLAATLDSRIKLIRWNRREGTAPLLMMARLNLFILRMKPDIIHAHHHKFGRLVQVRRKNLLLTVHDIDTPMTYCATTRMVAITDAVEANVRERVPSARISTIYNGIRTADIALKSTEATTNSIVRLVQVARINTEKKGQDILIRALGELKRRGITNVEADFIGREDDRPILETIAEEEGVTDKVHYLGLRSRAYIYSHLREYDAMCHPSRWEGFGLIIAEAMAAGLPIITTENDGPWEVADHGRLCISLRNGSAESCADAIEAFINDREGAKRRASEGLEYVKRFDISNTINNYISLYRSIINGNIR